MSEISLVDRIICAASAAWKDDGEVLATGSGQDLAVFAASAALRGESIAPPASPLFSELAEQLHDALAKSPIVVEWSDA